MNYARYWSCCGRVLKQIESKHPGLKELLLPCGLSVQAQETHPVGTEICQVGEQAINRDAKTSGMWMVSWSRSSISKKNFFKWLQRDSNPQPLSS